MKKYKITKNILVLNIKYFDFSIKEYKIQNTQYKIQKASFILLFVVLSLFMFTPEASAGIIVRAPAYLGLSNGLVGCWTFDGAYTKAPDCSGNNNTGTLTNGPTKVPGKLGQALSFDGVNDRIILPDSAPALSPGTGDFTISMWVKWNVLPTVSDTLIHDRGESNQDYTIIVSTTNNLHCGFSDGTNTAAAVSASNYLGTVVNMWRHYVCIRQGTTVYLYDNTSLLDSTTNASLGNVNTDGSWNPIIGSDITGGTEGVNAVIDDVRIYNRALSAAEISRLYRIGLGSTINRSSIQNPLDQGLVGHWTFDGADIGLSGTQAKDRSGNNNHGTLTNGPKQTIGKIGQGLSFDGVDDTVNINPGTQTNVSKATWSFWLNPNSVASNQVSFYGTYNNDANDEAQTLTIQTGEPFCGGGNDIRFILGGSMCTTGNVLTAGTWVHVAIVYDGTQSTNVTKVNVYINGVEQTSEGNGGGTTIRTTVNIIDTFHQIGRFSTVYFAGILDDVRVYNRALSAAEISRLYQSAQSKYNVTQPTLDQGLVGHWTFDGADIGLSGTQAKDRSGNNNHGTLTNGPIQAVGKIGQALNFDGVDDRVNLATDPIDVGTVTVCGWINPKVINSGERALYSNGRFFLGISNLNSRIRLYSNSAVDPPLNGVADSIVAGAWQHICAVRNSGTNGPASLYLNSVLSVSGNSGTPVSGLSQRAIGDDGFGDYFFNGSIDDVRIYNRALTAGEIQKLYNMGR